MTDKEPTTLGELSRFMELKFEQLTSEISKMTVRMDNHVERREFELTVSGLNARLQEGVKDIESMRATAKWAIGIAITVAICVIGLVAKTGVL